jgi:hypothetical protein
MSQIVKPHTRQAGATEKLLERLGEVDRINGFSGIGRKDQSRVLPVRARQKSFALLLNPMRAKRHDRDTRQRYCPSRPL